MPISTRIGFDDLTATLYAQDRHLGTLTAGELSVSSDSVSILRNVVLQTQVAAVPACNSIAAEMKDLILAFGEEDDSPTDYSIDPNKGNARRISWQKLRIEDLTITAKDLQLEVGSITVSPGRIGMFKTGMFQDIEARDLHILFPLGETTRTISASAARWQFPVGKILLQNGQIEDRSDGKRSFVLCAIRCGSWDVIDSPVEEPSFLFPSEEEQPCRQRRDPLNPAIKRLIRSGRNGL
ncbi:MAG TPA: hypothetical protein PLQ35_12970 [bacterium]|nr:hypothetical protein [bacterium]HQL63196.1 hypothetical protein [bacterium]